MNTRPMYPKPKSIPVPKKKPAPISKSKAAMAYFDKAAFARERGNICECSECNERAEDIHHCLFPRSIKFPELDVKENFAYVNHFEHVSLRKFSSLEWKKFFWRKNCERYTEAHMRAWIASLPAKLQSRVDFIN